MGIVATLEDRNKEYISSQEKFFNYIMSISDNEKIKEYSEKAIENLKEKNVKNFLIAYHLILVELDSIELTDEQEYIYNTFKNKIDFLYF